MKRRVRLAGLIAASSLLAACDATMTTTGVDMSSPPVADLATAPPADMATAGDMATVRDMVITGPPDIAMAGDMAKAPPADMAGPAQVIVFADDYGPGVSFAPFGGSMNDVKIDMTEKHGGAASLKITVPNTSYTGGAFKATPTDLSGYTAVTFWAKASKAVAFDTFGLGNDGADTTYQGEWHAAPITTQWTKFIVPIPLPSKLKAQGGLFHFAQGGNGPYTVWLDDIQYENLSAQVLGAPAPAIATETVTKSVGDTFDVNGAATTWMINGAPVGVATARPYFTWTSSKPQFASVDGNGRVTAVAVGSSDITASLGAVAAAGKTTMNVIAPAAPQAAPTRPALAAGNVISLWSNAYTNVPVDTWSAVWDMADVTDVKVGNDDVKKYTNLAYAGIEFTTKTIDATQMTAFHVDAWTPDSTVFKIKLVDFGADGKYAGGDDKEHELVFDANSTPKLVTQSWIGFDIPLANFVGLTTRAHLAQLIISGSTSTVFVDNVYFHK